MKKLLQKIENHLNLGRKGTIGTPKEPVKCLECGEPHLRINFPHLKETNNIVHNLQEASTFGEVGKIFHQINVVVEDRQANHQSTIVEIEGTISK